MARVALSERESEVLWLIAWGYTSREIAARLEMSDKTVDTYKTRAGEKLNLKNRRAIVRHALQRGWFDIDPEQIGSLAKQLA